MRQYVTYALTNRKREQIRWFWRVSIDHFILFNKSIKEM